MRGDKGGVKVYSIEWPMRARVRSIGRRGWVCGVRVLSTSCDLSRRQVYTDVKLAGGPLTVPDYSETQFLLVDYLSES